MNERSLARANTLLAAMSEEVQVGEVWPGSAVTLGESLGFAGAVEAARAVRALITRGRIGQIDGGYLLLDPRPITPGERTSVAHRTPDARRQSGAIAEGGSEGPGQGGFAETEDLRAQVRALREEVRALRILVGRLIADPQALGGTGFGGRLD